MSPSPTTHQRVVETATRLTADLGWSHVTMARLAEETGVSRQTVYNEVGSRNGLAGAMIQAELDRFLDLVSAALDAEPDDLSQAIEASAQAVLEHARDNTLLKAVVSATHGADTELLPLLTTQSEPLLAAAKALLLARVVDYAVELAPDDLEVAVEVVVRLVLSHVMQPGGAPGPVAADIAWVARRVLGRSRRSGAVA